MERRRALSILGLAEGASSTAVRSAHAALRAHVEVRRRRAPNDEVRGTRDEELEELDSALELLAASASYSRLAALTRRSGFPLLLWALLATGLALFFGLRGWLSEAPAAPREARVLAEVEAESLVGATGDTEAAGDALVTAIAIGGDPGAADAGSPGAVESARMELIAEANLPGAMLQIRSGPDAEPEVEGPADSRSYWLEPGSYQLRVSHPDCPDAWAQELDARPGEPLELSPMVCVETGWLVVKASEPDAKVVIDAKQSGAAGATRRSLSVGEHRVEVAKAGFEDWQGLVDIQSAQLLELFAELKPAEEPKEEESTAKSDEEKRASQAYWHDRVTRWLLSRYDTDRSGLLDEPDEVDSVPCDEWLGLEASFDRSGLGLSLIRIYGLDHVDTGGEWVEDALGISYGMSDYAYKRMRTCGLK